MHGERRRRRDAAAILRDPQPYLQPLAAHLGGEGTIPEVVARLEETLGRVLAPAESLDVRPPANVLLSGTASACERNVVLAVLLKCLGHETGVAELPSGRLVALVRTDQGWRAVCQPSELARGHLRAILPKQPGVVATLGRPPTTAPGPVAPTLVFLGQYRRVGSEPRG
jgi:sirohydrochlorin ferrochelatase